MGVGECEERDGRADGCHEHVPLCVPRITLGSEEVFSCLAGGECGTPFDELVARAEREAGGEAYKREKFPLFDWREAEEELSSQDSGHESLGKVA